MSLNPATLARVQFAFTVSFHIIFPTMSIGLAMFLAVIEGLWLKTKDALYLQIYRFWLSIFAMGFGVGVVTGIVLSFEFGLGFAKFAQLAGPAIGPMIALEVLTSFFLEAGFLGIMLFGMHRVGPKLHFFATCMVALGTLLSASWILSANSWMQTPDGVAVRNGRLIVVNWWHVLNNPSWLVRLPHMVSAAYLTASFLVAGVGAWYLLRGKHLAFAKKSVALGTAFATVLIAGQVFIGDLLYGTMLKYQPSKMQAAEGFWAKESASPAPYYWVILPDQKEQRNRVRPRHSVLRQHLAHTQPSWARGGSEEHPAGPTAHHGHGLLWVPHYVRDRHPDVRRGDEFSLASMEAPALHHEVVSPLPGSDDAVRHYCDAWWMVCRGDRAPALGDLRLVENDRCRFTGPGADAPRDADRIYMYLHVLHGRISVFRRADHPEGAGISFHPC